MAWQMVKLGDICSISKGKTEITKAIPGEYPMVALSEDRKSHNEYQFDEDAVIIPLIPKDPSKVSAEFLYHYLDMTKEILFVPLMKGVANVSLPMKRIAGVEIPLPALSEQESIVEILQQHKAVYKLLDYESEKQLLTKYRQAILQEAIEGKLTADWRAENPDIEPAAELLKRIAAEKAELVKQKKIPKQKPLPAIKPDEIPFDIPESWKWCKFHELSLHIEAGKSPACHNYPAPKDQWGVLKISAISWDKFLEGENKQIINEKNVHPSSEVKEGNFIMTRANTAELVGKSVVESTRSKLMLNDKTLRVIWSNVLDIYWVNLAHNSFHAREYYASVANGASASMKNISRENIASLLFPLPPFTEQQEIVRRIETKFALCDQLEAQINDSAHSAETLSAAILQELFDQNGGEE